MPDHYDVIIIGTGAGGGTLAHTLAATGQADPHARAGELPPPRDGQLEPRAGVRRRPLHLARHLVRLRRLAVPAAGALLRRWRHQALRRRALPAATGRLRRAAARRRHLARVARHLRRLRAVLHQGRVALPGARPPWRGPDRGALEQAVPVARGVARTAHPGAVRRAWSRGAITRSRRRAGSCSTRRTRHAALASGAPGATAIRAWCTRSPMPRRSRCGRSSTCRTSRCW